MSHNDPPPSYEAATASSSAAPAQGIRRVSTDSPAARTARNGIPPDQRRSMEDEGRDLPEGWVRSFDPESSHQFFVDTRADPPRSIWTHPYDDEEYLSTLSPAERAKQTRIKRTMTMDDLAAEDSDHEGDHPSASSGNKSQAAAAGSRQEPELSGFSKFSRKWKDKVTGTTHAEREQARIRRAEQERKAYEIHLRTRQALIKAIETGEPQFIYKDQQGRDVYIEPPRGAYAPPGARGYNPYTSGPYQDPRYSPHASGLYQDPNTRFLRPVQPYGRPYGYGYGGGAGLPLAAGLLGGGLLGAALF